MNIVKYNYYFTTIHGIETMILYAVYSDGSEKTVGIFMHKDLIESTKKLLGLEQK